VQTTAWLYNFWKVGLPLAVIAYSLLKDDDSATSASQRSPESIIFAGIAVVIAIVCGLTWIAIAGERFYLPCSGAMPFGMIKIPCGWLPYCRWHCVSARF
jgi:hypothetical protein